MGSTCGQAGRLFLEGVPFHPIRAASARGDRLMGSTCRQAGRLFLEGAPLHPHRGSVRARRPAHG